MISSKGGTLKVLMFVKTKIKKEKPVRMNKKNFLRIRRCVEK